MAARVPLIVLAGNDPRPPRLPSGREDLHPIVGAKAVDLRIGGRPLIQWVLERARASRSFHPIYVAGNRTKFEGIDLGDAEIIDTDRSFGENIQVALAEVSARHPGRAVAFLTCDVLAEPEELARLLAEYRAEAPLDFWFPIVVAPKESAALGASAWKPRYQVAHVKGGEPESLLPAHLLIVDPKALRLPLLFRSFEIAYETRNQQILLRLWKIVRAVVGGLMGQDLRLLLRGVFPTLTASVVGQGVALGFRLRRGVMSAEEVAERLNKMFVRRGHRRKFPERRGQVVLVDTLSLAKDIDTFEEAREVDRALGGSGA